MDTQPNGKPVTLENYDGTKAYFGSTRYAVLELEGVKYAFPNPSEQIELAGVTSQGELERKFPVFQIVDEHSGHETARAVNANHKRTELSQLLDEIGQDFQ